MRYLIDRIGSNKLFQRLICVRNAFLRNNSESFLDVVNGMSHNKVGKCELV